MRRRTGGKLLLSVCLLLGRSVALRAFSGADESLTWQEPSAGALLVRENGPLTPRCSGVLIGCQTFLTAAHCLCGREVTGATCQASGLAVAAEPVVLLQHGGLFQAADVRINPAYDYPAADLALIRLQPAVAGIAPAMMVAQPAPVGSAATVLSFGRSGGSIADAGLKRPTAVETTACPATFPDEWLCWTFTGAAPRTCEGQDGAPLFLDGGGGGRVAGIGLGFTRVSLGPKPPVCTIAGAGLDADLAGHVPWIVADAGSDVNQRRCGDVPQVGEAGSGVTAIAGRLGPTHTSAAYAFEVTPGTRLLRIVLNAQDTAPPSVTTIEPPNDVDLFVRARGSARLADYCAVTGADAYAACEFPSPASGRWDVHVDRIAGAGDYQLTATTFGGDPPSCGNGRREVGEQCDGQDDESCPAGCTGRCACVTCHEGRLEFGDVQFSRRFLLKGVLHDPNGGASLNPRRHGFVLTVADDQAALMRVAIPPRARGWFGSRPRHGLYRWHGLLQGIRRIRLQRRPHRPAEWRVVVEGERVLGANVLGFHGLALTIAVGESCVVKTFP